MAVQIWAPVCPARSSIAGQTKDWVTFNFPTSKTLRWKDHPETWAWAKGATDGEHHASTAPAIISAIKDAGV